MEKQNKCLVCNADIESKFNFCPYCGEPVSDLAKEIMKKQNSIAQLKLLSALSEKIKDENSLDLIGKLLEQYKKNI